ncbi:unnamed protein product [Psylliodes chrysocephalus]|uniref:folate gamma-glutamyl hydrolase n=1 Tax=Psylliodes chrysocephalus TaxID=3402493 RepID=A0A9P0GIZ0_9CUCU|nr:unnamed protein product [Psylliodes chrysocephala]
MFRFILFYSVFHLCSATDAPIIGILAQATDSYDADTYIAASYVKFVESAGGRVLPIWINQPADYYERVVSYTNGVLFPGGDSSFETPGGYGETARTIYQLAQAANDQGRFFPIWGTCLGFEVLPFAELGKDITVNCSIPDDSYTLDFAGDFRKSKLYDNLPSDLLKILLTKNVTYNAHSYCLTEKTLRDNGLDMDWHILTTNTDTNGLKFISSMENVRYPFYGIQFHPEKNGFEFKDNQGFAHSSDSVRVMWYFSNFFISLARKNVNKFPSRELLVKSLIYNWCPQFTGLDDKYFFQIYSFAKTDYSKHLLL